LPAPKSSVGVRASFISLLLLAGYSIALFLPMIGHGFIHDDFVHLCSVVYDPLRRGLTEATGGPFYAPLAWLSYKIDWMVWGWNPLAFSAVNLTLHISNILLVYHLGFRLYRSAIAARWAAVGFALLFPANTWAVMWISTRAHLIVTFFYLATMLAALWYSRTEDHRFIPFIAIVLLSGLTIFSKESGVTLPGAIAIVLLRERMAHKKNYLAHWGIIGLFATLFALLLIYKVVRAQSGAIPITFSGDSGYFYALSPKLLLEHLLRYAWRTYGLLAILAGAITLSLYLRRNTHKPGSVTWVDLIFSVALFSITIAPFILLPTRSGIYSYLPGIAAALLFGSIARSFYESPVKPKGGVDFVTISPIIIVILIYSCFTIGHSLRWKKMAELNAAVLDQIVRQQPKIEPNALIVLIDTRVENRTRFPESFAWGFPYALRVIYREPTIDGIIIRQGEPYNKKPTEIHLVYRHSADEQPIITSFNEVSGMD
jgi:hypothetical protein